MACILSLTSRMAFRLNEILDDCKIVFLTMLETLAIMKDKILILRRDNFGLDFGYARLAV